MKFSNKTKNFTYAVLFIACTASAYQVGTLWSEKKPLETVEKTDKVTAPKTIKFQLKDGIVNAWDLPDFNLKDTKGERHSLSDWKGKLILLNFWATWCPPCRFEIPEFVEYQEKYAQDGLQIIGIGIGEEKPIKNFARTLEINYPVLITESSQIMMDWGNETQILPYSVLINRDGKILYIHRGQLSKLSFKYEIEPFIKETTSVSQ